MTIFGGFAPFVATWLIAGTGDPLSPSFYLIATAFLSIIALVAVQRRAAGSRAREQFGAPADIALTTGATCGIGIAFVREGWWRDNNWKL